MISFGAFHYLVINSIILKWYYIIITFKIVLFCFKYDLCIKAFLKKSILFTL